MPSAVARVKPDDSWNPPCVRFGDMDPRTWHFGWLLLCLELGTEHYEVDRHLRALRELGFDIALTDASARSPEQPKMTPLERRRFDAGERMPWEYPNAVGGDS